MEGGLLQLAVKGREDVHLTSEPDFSYYEMVYKKHTNFSIQNNVYNITGKKFGQEIEFKIPKGGDLLSNINLEVFLPKIMQKVEKKSITENIIDNEFEINNLKYYLLKKEDLLYLIPELLLKNNNINLKEEDIKNYQLSDNNYSFIINNIDNFYVIDFDNIKLLKLSTNLNEKMLIYNLNENNIAKNDFLSSNKIFEGYEKNLNNLFLDNFDFYYSNLLDNSLKDVNLSSFGEISNFYKKEEGNNIYTLNSITNYDELKDVIGSYFDFIIFLFNNHFEYDFFINYFIDSNSFSTNPSRVGNVIDPAKFNNPFENLDSIYSKTYDIHKDYEIRFYNNRTVILQIYDNIVLNDKKTFYINTVALTNYYKGIFDYPLIIVDDFKFPNKVDINIDISNNNFVRTVKQTPNKAIYDILISTNENNVDDISNLTKDANIVVNNILLLIDLIEEFDNNNYVKEMQGFDNYSKNFISEFQNISNVDYNYLVRNSEYLPDYLTVKFKEIGPLIFLRNKVVSIMYKLVKLINNIYDEDEDRTTFNAYLYFNLKNVLTLKSVENSFNQLLYNKNLMVYSEDDYESFLNIISRNNSNYNNFLNIKMRESIKVKNDSYLNPIIDSDGFYIIKVKFNFNEYSNYYDTEVNENNLLEYFEQNGNFLKMKVNKEEYNIINEYNREVPYIDFDYDLFSNNNKKFKISKYERLLECKSNIYLIFDKNVNLLENNKININLSKEVLFIDVVNNNEVLVKKNSYDYDSKIYLLRLVKNDEIFYKKIKILGISNGIIINELLNDKYLYSKIELIVFNSLAIDIDINIENNKIKKQSLYRNIANKIFENYSLDDLNNLYIINFNTIIGNSLNDITIEKIYRLIDSEFLNMNNSFKLLSLKSGGYYIYGTIDGKLGYHYPVYFTNLEARINDVDRLSIEKTIVEYNFKVYISNSNFNYSKNLNNEVTKYSFFEIISNSINIKLNRKIDVSNNVIYNLDTLDDLEITWNNLNGVNYNKIRLFHNRKLPNLLNFTSSSISQYPQEIIFDYFIHQPAIIKLKNSKNYVLLNMGFNSNEIYINEKQVVNLCPIDSNQLMRNNFTKMSFNFDDDILLISKDEIKNKFTNMINSKYLFLLNIDEIINIIINNDKSALEYIKKSSDLINLITNNFRDRFINLSNNISKYYIDKDNQTFFNLYSENETEIVGMESFFISLIDNNRFVGLPWKIQKIVKNSDNNILNIRNYLFENIQKLLDNEEIINNYNSSNVNSKLIENYQKDIYEGNNFKEIDFYNKSELNLSFLNRIFYKENLDYQLDITNNKIYFKEKDIVETDFYRYSEKINEEKVDITYFTIINNRISDLIINDPIFSILIDNNNKFKSVDNLNEIYNPLIFNINKEPIILNQFNYLEKIVYIYEFSNMNLPINNIFLVKNIGLLVVKDVIYLISEKEIEINPNFFKSLIVKPLDYQMLVDIVLNLENVLDNYVNSDEIIINFDSKLLRYNIYNSFYFDQNINDNYFIYYENGSYNQVTINNFIIFNIEGYELDKIILLEKSKINLLSTTKNKYNKLELIEYFSEKYIFDNSNSNSLKDLFNIVKFDNKNYMVYLLDNQDFYLTLEIIIKLEDNKNYIEITDNDNQYNSLLGGFIFYNNFYWKILNKENNKLITELYELFEPLEYSININKFKIKLPINTNDIYNYKMNNTIMFTKSIDVSWNYIDGINKSILGDINEIKFNNEILVLDISDNNYKFNETKRNITKLIDIENKIERVIKIFNNQENFNFIIYSGLESDINNDIINDTSNNFNSSYVYLDNSAIIVKIYTNNEKISSVYTNNRLFTLSIEGDYYVKIIFDYDNLTNDLNEGIIFIRKDSDILNLINLVVFKNGIYNRLDCRLNNNFVIEPIKLESDDELNLMFITVNEINKDDSLWDISGNGLVIKKYNENININFGINGYIENIYDNYIIFNLLTYNLELKTINSLDKDKLVIFKNDNNLMVKRYDEINLLDNIDDYDIFQEINPIMYNINGYIDRNNYLYTDINLVDNLLIEINGNYYFVVKSFGNISKIIISQNSIDIILPEYFDKIIIIGRIGSYSYNYIEHILHKEKNNLFKSISNSNLLNLGDYFIKNDIIQVNVNQNVDNCFGVKGNYLTCKVFKNMLIMDNSFLLDLKILDMLYDGSNNIYKIERLLDNIIIIDKNISDNLITKTLYIPYLNYILVSDLEIVDNDNYKVINENKYGLLKKIKVNFEYKMDLCVNWYNNSPNRYSNKVRFEKVGMKMYKISNNLSLNKLVFYYNQVLGVCKDFNIINYAKIKDFDLVNGTIIIDNDYEENILLFVFNSENLLKDDILVNNSENENNCNILNTVIKPCYDDYKEEVNLMVFYLDTDYNSYSTNFIIKIYKENNFYKFRSEDLAIYENGYYVNNPNVLYLIDGLNMIRLIKENNFVYRIEPMELNPSNLVLLKEEYDYNTFFTLVKIENNKIISNFKIHSKSSKFYVNNLFEIKIRQNKYLEYFKPILLFVNNYRNINDNYLMVYSINIKQKEPVFDTIINKFLVEIEFIQDYDDFKLENLLLYKCYSDENLLDNLKLLMINNKIFIETNKLLNYTKIYLVQNNQLKVKSDLSFKENKFENNLLRKSIFTHHNIELRWYGINNNYLVNNPKLNLLNKVVDINKPFNSVKKVYQNKENTIIETQSELLNVPNNINITMNIDIYQNNNVNNLDITIYSTMNNLNFRKIDLDILYKFSRDNIKLLNLVNIFMVQKNVRFISNIEDYIINDNTSIFNEDEIIYYKTIMESELELELELLMGIRNITDIILNLIEKYNNFGFWVSWVEVIENEINKLGYSIDGNCLHKLTENLDSDKFIKIDTGYLRKNTLTYDIDIIKIDDYYVILRDKNKLNNFIDTLISSNVNRYGINIDILLNNISNIIKYKEDIKYTYNNEIKSLEELYNEYLWNKYKFEPIYKNINPDIEINKNEKLFRHEIDLNTLDEDRLDYTDIKIYNEQQIISSIVFNKKAIFYENEINTDSITLSTLVNYPINQSEYLGKYYRLDLNNNTTNENLKIKVGEEFINVLEIDDKVVYVALKEINNLDHIEYVNSIYVTDIVNTGVLNYNRAFEFQKSYIFDNDKTYFIPNNYQKQKIYFYCNQFGINLGLDYNLDISKNTIDYHQKINVQIINNRYIFDNSLNNLEVGKIYLFDQSHISNLNYPMKIAMDLSFNEYYTNSYGLSGINKVIYFAPIKTGKVYFYTFNKNLENVINEPYDFGFNYNNMNIIDDNSMNLNIINVDVYVDLINRRYVLSNTLYQTGKIYKFNVMNFIPSYFGLTLNLYYLFNNEIDQYIPVILDNKIINVSNSLIIKNNTIYELIEVKDILKLTDLNKFVYSIKSETINRNIDYISSNIEENIYIDDIIPFKVYINTYNDFIITIDNQVIEFKNIVHFSNLNQSLPLNINSIQLENKIYYDIYVNDILIMNSSQLVIKKINDDIINATVVENQFIINSNKLLKNKIDLKNEMIVNNIYQVNYNVDDEFIYIDIPLNMIFTFMSDYDIKYILVDNSNIIIDYTDLLIIDESDVINNKIRIDKELYNQFYNNFGNLFINQYIYYVSENKLFNESKYFNLVMINPSLEINYDKFLIDIRNNPNYDYIYGIELSEELINFNYYIDKIYLLYNDNKLITLDFIYLDQINRKKIIIGSNILVYNINKILVNNQLFDIASIINIKKQFEAIKINGKFLLNSDIININSNFLSLYYKMKISGYNTISIKNKFINEEIIIKKKVVITENIENFIQEIKYVDDIVFKLFKQIGFYINDELVEELTPDIYKMIYNFHNDFKRKENVMKIIDEGDNYKFSLPLEFWFKQVHLNLPLIAMNNTDIYLRIKVAELNKLLKLIINNNNNNNNNNNLKINVDMDTILLDDTERMLFGSKGHEYIIERYVDYKDYRLNKLQSVNRIPIKGMIKNIYWYGNNYNTDESYIKNIIVENEEKYQEYLNLVNKYNLYLKEGGNFELDFSILSKNKKLLLLGNDLITGIKNSKFLSKFDIEFILFIYEKYINPKNNIKSIINRLNMYFVHLYYSKQVINKYPIMKDINIKINGTTLFGKRDELYFGNVIANKNLTNIPDDNYYFISFALYPEEHQPSGHLNFNKLDEFVIISNNDERVLNENYQLKVVVKEYQILRIIGGMASLMW